MKNKKSSSRFYVSPLDDGKGMDKYLRRENNGVYKVFQLDFGPIRVSLWADIPPPFQPVGPDPLTIWPASSARCERGAP